MCTLNLDILFASLCEFQNKNTAAEISLVEGTMEKRTDALDKNPLDLAVVAAPHGFSDRFEGPVLYQESYVVAYGDRHRFGNQVNVEMTE